MRSCSCRSGVAGKIRANRRPLDTPAAGRDARKLRWALAACLGLALCTAWSAPVEDEICFRWNPPDGLVRRELCTSVRRAERPDAGSHVDRKQVLTEVAYHTRPSGYICTATPLSFSSTRDGTPTFDEPLALFDGIPLTYRLNAVGRLQGIDGLAAVVQRARARPAPNPMMFVVVSERNYRRALERTWEERAGGLVGRRGRIGESWQVSDQYPLPTKRALAFSTTTRLVERVVVEGRDCVRLENFYHSTPEPRSATWESPVPMASQVHESEINGWGEMIVDPTTLVVYRERTEFVIRFKPGDLGPQPVVVLERREYKFQPGGNGRP